MKDLQYVLHVDIQQSPNLPKSQGVNAFEEAVIDFLNAGGFARLAGGPSLEPLELLRAIPLANGEKPKLSYPDPSRYPDHVHFWSVPNVQTLALATLMNESRDDALYKKTDKYVWREQQHFIYYDALRDFNAADPKNLVRHLPGGTAPSLQGAVTGGKPPPRPRYVRVVHEFERSERIPPYAANAYGLYSALAVILATYMQLGGWKSRGIYWNVTGLLDTFTELWRVDTGLEGSFTEPQLKGKWLEPLSSNYPKHSSIDLVGFCTQIPSSFTLLEPYAWVDETTSPPKWQAWT
ncbi:MAG: hypothetical protein ABTD50_01160 [Polyangiaceae bacterium]|jgi:hypothetical protein